MRRISSDAAENILGFLGYGNPAAKLWFIGLEEGLGQMSDEDSMRNIEARGKWDFTMDLVNAHLSLVELGAPYDIAQRIKFTAVWIWIAKFARALSGASDWSDLVQAKHYIRTQLGRKGGGTFMTYASPIPERRLEDRAWTREFEQSGVSIAAACRKRSQEIRRLIQVHGPTTVICHGTSATNAYQALLPARRWEYLSDLPKVQMAAGDNGSYYFITPFFGVGQMSDDLAKEIVNVIRGLPRDEKSAAIYSELQSNPEIRSPIGKLKCSDDKSSSTTLNMSVDDFYADGTNPKLTVQLLDRLIQIGFRDDAFCRLHHKRARGKNENIKRFRDYCIKTVTFRPGDNNDRVHQRLLYVLRGRLADPNQPFPKLADAAYQRIPPIL